MQETEFVYRDTDIMNVDYQQVGVDFLHPEKIQIQFKTKKYPIDIGALAYSERESVSKSGFDKPIAVDINSLKINRRIFLSKLLDKIHSHTGSEVTSIRLTNDCRTIISWFDTNEHQYALETVDDARSAYFSYSHYIRSRLKLDEIKIATAYGDQRACRELFEIAFPEQFKIIHSAATLIKIIRSDKDAPPSSKVHLVKDTCLTIFEQYSKVILNNSSFPWFIEFKGFDAHVFPYLQNPFITPYAVKDSKQPLPYDYQNGKILAFEEAANKVSRYYALKEYVEVLDNFNNANSDKYHAARYKHATIAFQAYIQVFLITAASNISTIRNIPWDDDYKLEKQQFNNEFGELKLRANGKPVSYSLGKRGIKLFKQFIKLREYVLNGKESQYLFFIKSGATSAPTQMKGHIITKFYDRAIGRYFPHDFKTLTNNDIRLYKTDDMYINDESPEIIADMMQHTQKTSEQTYARGRHETQKAEFTEFWSDVRKISIQYDDQQTSIVADSSIPAGHCDSINKPEAIHKAPPIQPDCGKSQGCLFCKHYSVHADKEDISKLFSLLFVMTEVRKFATDYKHADQLFQDVTLRIKAIIEQMNNHSPSLKELITQVEVDVMEHGLLTPFWEMKLQRYEKMGVII
jgi:hypothetical protein